MGKQKIVKDTSERWLLTYADLMNLLLIFFIILYAMSQVDQSKAEELAEAMHNAFGTASGPSMISKGGSAPGVIQQKYDVPSAVIVSKLEKEQLEEVKKKVESLIGEKNLQGEIGVSMEERGVRVSISAKLLFKSGSAEVEKESLPLIKEIGTVLLQIAGKNIRVEGHTDNDPIHTSAFPSNWELSSSRSDTVLHYLVDKVGLDPSKISSVGYGEYRPIAPNDSEINKAKNRRVDLVIIKSMYDVAEAGAKTLEEEKVQETQKENVKKEGKIGEGVEIKVND